MPPPHTTRSPYVARESTASHTADLSHASAGLSPAIENLDWSALAQADFDEAGAGYRGEPVQRVDASELRIGEVRRQSRLGTEAAYRLCALDIDHVDVEVVYAPGLQPGFRMRLTRRAFEAMSRLAPDH